MKIKIISIFIISAIWGCSRQSHKVESQNACNTSHLIPSEFCNAQFLIQESDSVYGNCNISCFQTHYRYPNFSKSEKDSFFILVNQDILHSLTNVVSIEDELHTYFIQYQDLIQKFPEYRSNWSIMKDCQLLQMNQQLMTLQTKKSSYTGGAHHIQETIYLTYDLQKKKLLDLNALFKSEFQLDFKNHIIEHLKSQFDNNQNKTLAEMGFLVNEEDFPIKGNFYVTESALHIHYNPYEIAPYSTGDIHLKIPLKDIQKWLLIEYQKP